MFLTKIIGRVGVELSSQTIRASAEVVYRRYQDTHSELHVSGQDDGDISDYTKSGLPRETRNKIHSRCLLFSRDSVRIVDAILLTSRNLLSLSIWRKKYLLPKWIREIGVIQYPISALTSLFPGYLPLYDTVWPIVINIYP